MRTVQSLAFLVFALLLLSAPPRAQVLLSDDFNDNKLDTTKWRVVTKGIPHRPAVYERNKRAELQGRGYLVTTAQFDPQKTGAFVIKGTWTVPSVPGAYDFVQVYTRCDATPSGRYGEVANGLHFNSTIHRTPRAVKVRVQARGTSITTSNNSYSGSIALVPGKTYGFTAVDAGSTATFTMWEVGGTAWASGSCRISKDTSTLKHIVFHNREALQGTTLAHLDDVVVQRAGPLMVDRAGLSVAQGGTVSFALAAGKAHANRLYLVLGSLSGTTPGIKLGNLTLPLNPDSYTVLTAAAANATPVFTTTLGLLDRNGNAPASVTLPAGLATALVGRTAHHAFFVAGWTPGNFLFTSNAVAVSLTK